MILAIDPGLTTGFCKNDKAYQINFSQHVEPHRLLYDHLLETNPDFILYETFHWRQGQLNTVFTGVEYIGVIRLWAQTHSTPAVAVNPSDGKGFWNDNKIKSLGLWVPGCSHGMDALRLYLTWQMKNDKKWFNTVLFKLTE